MSVPRGFPSHSSEIQRDELVRGGIFWVPRGKGQRPKLHWPLVSPISFPSGTRRDRSISRGRVRFADHGSGWGLPDRPLHAALAQEEALRGYQPWSGGGERLKDGVGEEFQSVGMEEL